MKLVLKDEKGNKVAIGNQYYDFRNENKYSVTGWQEPTHCGSTGRVYCKKVLEDGSLESGENSYFPSVLGLEWEEETENNNINNETKGDINMNNFNNNTNGNSNNNNFNNTINGGKIMNNKIKTNRQAEVEAKAAAAKEAAKETRLAAIEPVDIIGTMDEVTNNSARAVRDENGNTVGTNGGKLYQSPVYNEDGTVTTIAAESKDALETLKVNIEAGLQGDGKFHKLVTIGGMLCDCAGTTLEELEADIAAAEDYYQKHINGSVIRDIDVAEQLVDAEYKKSDLEQINGKDGRAYILCYDGNYIMTLSGETVVSLDNIKSILCRDDVKTLLIEKLNIYIDEQEALMAEYGEDDDWYDEDYDDEWDEEEDNDDEENTFKSDFENFLKDWFN